MVQSILSTANTLLLIKTHIQFPDASGKFLVRYKSPTFPSTLEFTTLLKAVLQSFDIRHKHGYKLVKTVQVVQHELQKELSNLCKSLLEQKLHLITFPTFLAINTS